MWLPALVLLWAIITWWARREYLPYDVNNTDIATTLHQAQTFAAGKISRVTPEPREFFQQYQVIVRDRSYTYYPPGHALAITPAVWLGVSPWIVTWLEAAFGLVLMFLWARRLVGERTAAFATYLLAISPFFAANAPSLLSHSTALFLALVFLWSVAKWAQEGSAAAACLAGVSLAAIFATRSPNAAALGAVWIPWVLWLRRDRVGAEIKSWIGFVAGAASLTAPLLVYYRILGGRWRLDLFTDYWPRNHFGFGRDLGRGEVGAYFQTSTNHDVSGMLANWKFSFLNLCDWWSGNMVVSFVFLGIGIFLVVRRLVRIRDPGSRGLDPALAGRPSTGSLFYVPLVGWCLLHIFLYSLYFTPSTGYSGPRYLFEIVPALAIGCGWVVSRWAAEPLRDHPSSGTFPWSAAAILFFATLFAVGGQVSFYAQNAPGIAPRRQVERCVRDGARAPALVLLRSFWIGHPYPIFLNDASMNAPVIFACDRGEEDRKLIAAFPDRNAYVLAITPEGAGVRTRLIPIYDGAKRKWLCDPGTISAPFFFGGGFSTPVELRGEVARKLFHPRPEEIVAQDSIPPKRWPLVP